jgi:phosphoribosylformylglycinamidine synthase
MEDVDRHCTGGFKDQGDLVFLLGGDDGDGLGGSEYLELVHGVVAGRPVIDLDVEKKAQQCCLSLIRSGVIKSAHDCSDGGLAVALAECCIWGEIGFKGGWRTKGRLDAALFGEGPSRFVVSVAPTKAAMLKKEAARRGVQLTKLGEVGGPRLMIEGLVNKRISDLKEAWQAPLRW